MKTKITLFLICLFSISTTIQAQIAIDDSNYNWSRIENTTAVALVFNDADNGDGLNDGAVNIKGTSSATTLQGAQYLLSGSPIIGEQINLEAKYYQNAASNVKFKMQIFNATDNLVLAETAVVSSSGQNVVGITALPYTFTAASVNDQIMVRFVRVDDLNTVRIVAIDYLKVNGQFTNMTVLCAPVFNFDIPLTTATPSEINNLNAIRSSLSDQYLGTTAPSATAINNAVTQYNALNINESGTTITGNAITDIAQIAFLKTFAQYLKFTPNDTNISDKAVNAVWYLSSLTCIPKSNDILTFYNYPEFSRPTIFLNSYLSDNIKALFGNTLYTETNSFKYLFDANYDFNTTQTNGAISTDIMYLDLDVLFAYADWFNSNDEKIRFLKTAKRFLDRFLIHTYGQKDGLKKDGLSYHHSVSYDGYMYAFSTISTVFKSLENTNFQIDQPSYLRFRDAIYAQLMYSNDAAVMPFSMGGRSPQKKTTTLSAATLSKVAISGGKILGLTTADPLLAGIYNRKYGVNNGFNYSTVAPFEEGYIQFNTGNLGVYRKNNWIAAMKGQSDVLLGSEIYATQNRFGRYQGYGTLEIMYPGNNLIGNGFDVIGWDWNYNPGTTTIVLPWDKLHAEKERIDEENTYGFAGSLTLTQANKNVLSSTIGQSGLFAMKFKELANVGSGIIYGPNTHNATFEFTKTYFTIEDYIICLGSGIKNDDTVNPTVTPLFQRLNNNSNEIYVNGATKTNQSAESFDGTMSNWIIDNYNTGYYISPNSGTLKIRNSAQTTPYQNQVAPSDATIAGNASNNYHLAFLDHGNAPTNNSYEFVCIPSANPTRMTEFSQSMQTPQERPYIVHQNNINQQIIEHKASKTWAYSLPSSNTTITDGFIISNDTPCLAMYKGLTENSLTIVLSVSNPDLGNSPSTPKVITLKLKYQWNLLQPNPKVNIVSADATETIIQFTTTDGLPVEINLELEDSSVLSVANSVLPNQSHTIVTYPNPVNDYLYIQTLELKTNANIRIYNTLGAKVQEIGFTKATQKVSVGDIPVGTYFVVVQNGTETFKNTIIKK